jgi:hypothetical protein
MQANPECSLSVLVEARRDEPGREGTLQNDPLSKVGEGQ